MVKVVVYIPEAFPSGSAIRNPPAMQDTWVWSLGQEDPLEEGMATHSSILAWRIPWTEESGGIWSIGLQRVRHNWSDLACTHIHSSPVGPFCRITSLFYEILFSFDSPLTFDSSSFTGPLNAAIPKFYPWFLGSSVSFHFHELHRHPYFDPSPTSVLCYDFLYQWRFSRETKSSRMHT